MKRILCLFLCFLLLAPVGVWAEEYQSDISPAIEILRNQTKLQKHSPIQSTVSFRKEEFESLLGSKATHVTVVELPTGGVLQLNGLELEQGQSLSLRDTDDLRYVPSTQGSFQTSFRFKDSNKTNATSLECYLSFSEESPLEAEDQWIHTYRDCMTELSLLSTEQQEQGWQIRYESAPSNGLLNALEDGTVIYAPRTGFEGSDGFGYQMVHPDGRLSPLATVRIQVNAPYKDLFYANLKNSPLHAAAIDFTKYTDHTANKDENGNYLFDTEAILSLEECTAMIRKLMESQGYGMEVFEDEEKEEESIQVLMEAHGLSPHDNSFTYAQAAKAVSELLRST